MKKNITLLIFFIVSAYASITFSTEPEFEKTLSNYTPVLSPKFKDLLKTSNVADGELLFMRKCSSCHDEFKSTTHGKGPNLWNVFGRKAGSSKGFEYSDAMRQSGHTWNYETINYYLTNTEQAVPGRIMNFKGVRRDSDRAKLLLFLRSMNDKLLPLP